MLWYFESTLSWRELLRRTYKETVADNGLGLAAQLAYYFLLALFPAVLCVIALASFLPLQNFTDEVANLLGRFAPPEVITLIREQMTRLGNGSLFIAGESGMLALSSDGGRSWSKLKSPYDSSYFGALPVGSAGAVVYGLRGNVYLSTDVRGGRWTKLQTHSVASMFGGTVLPDGELAMVGLNGVIFIADASGKVRSLQTPTGTPLASAIPHNGGLLAVGESGVQLLASLK